MCFYVYTYNINIVLFIVLIKCDIYLFYISINFFIKLFLIYSYFLNIFIRKKMNTLICSRTLELNLYRKLKQFLI